MAWQEPEQAPGGYTENGVALVFDDEAGEIYVGERLDAATSLPSLDAVAPSLVEPEGGWPQGTRIVAGRPVRPVNHSVPSPPPSHRQPPRQLTCVWLAMRRRPARARQGRYRRTRRTRSPSRAGPSDKGEGGGEGPPPPVSGELEPEAEFRPAPRGAYLDRGM